MQLMIIISKYVLRFIYSILKIIPINKNKVVFCSRQSSSLPLDFKLIQDYIEKENSDIKCVSICCRVTSGIKSYMLFLLAVLKSMYHLATSKVCILDSYWPAVCMLNHKQELKVIQIWHALGKLKKSGYASVGKKSGRKQEYAKLIHMHDNYDYVIAGGEAWNPYYCESFSIDNSKILNYGLPRIDYLLATEERNRTRFFKENPALKGKKIVLYTPTFRRNMHTYWEPILDAFEDENIILIIKTHPGEKRKEYKLKNNMFYFEEWPTIDLIAVCDYLITDYSAIALEAAVLNKKTFYWMYDYEQYVENNGVNLDMYGIVPKHIFKDVNELFQCLINDNFNDEDYQQYRKVFLPNELGNSTEKIVNEILKSK